jgi:N-glycosylase/DNA lyase
MPTVACRFTCPPHYDLNVTANAHGWRWLAPFAWDVQKPRLHLACWAGEKAVDVSCTQKGDTVEARLTSRQKLTKDERRDAREQVKRALGLNVDTAPLLEVARGIDGTCARLVERGAGRLLRAPTLWEDAAKTLFTTNCSWALTVKMASALCSSRYSEATPSGAFPFPMPRSIARLKESSLRKNVPIGYRAPYLVAIAKRFNDDPHLGQLESGAEDFETVFERVKEFTGFGHYAASHLLVLAGYAHEIPVDTIVTAYVKRAHRARKPHSFVQRHYKQWGRYRWWGMKLERMILEGAGSLE